MTPLAIALIMFALSQLGSVSGAVLYFRSETHALRREVEQLRKSLDERRQSDRELTATQLNAIENSVARVERRIIDVLSFVGADRRSTDHPTLIATPE